ncbi:hypothetical protein GGD65_007850 [Bradyrhizobium sp. CIR18]|nr:hypothetical protein [Bradyrhizobium sp. CIR18]
MLIIEEDAINCASLAVSQDDGLADQLRLECTLFGANSCILPLWYFDASTQSGEFQGA